MSKVYIIYRIIHHTHRTLKYWSSPILGDKMPVNPRAAKVLQESIKISKKTHKIRIEGNISTPTTSEYNESKQRKKYRGSHLHLNNIVAIVTNNRIPCARVNLIFVPI
jgi:hypothetical protein